MRLASLGVRVMAFVVWSTAWGSPLASSGGSPAFEWTTIPEAWAVPDCAPWDGPAVSIDLTARTTTADRERPSFVITVWRSLDRAWDERFLIGAPVPWGVVTLCDARGNCEQPIEGSVRLHNGTAGQPLTGTYDLRFADGARRRGTFLAVKRERVALCG